MLELYVTLVKAEIRTLDSVPAAFREKRLLKRKNRNDRKGEET